MKKRTNKKAFTLTELIIIVAVIGILAAVVIPAFMNTTDKTKGRADEQLVASFNAALDSGKALKKDLSDVIKVRSHLIASGYSVEQMKNPQTVGDNENDQYAFVWDKSDETVFMIRLMTNEVVYPSDFNDVLNSGDWYALAPDGNEPANDPEKTEQQNYEAKLAFYSYPSAQKIAVDYFSEKIKDMTDADKEKSYLFAAKVSVSFTFNGVTYPIVENASDRVQTVYAVYDGTKVGTSDSPLGQFTVVNKMQNLRYNTTQASTEAWIVKYQAIGASNYEQIGGLYAVPYVEEAADGNTYRTFTLLSGISTSGDPIEQNWW